MLTCKDFLHALNEYLDETQDAELRQEVEKHVNECPNCWVVFDTTRKTLKVFKGMEPQVIPPEVHGRLMERLQKKMAQRQKPAP
ncbi:MAG: zf-HC2 domain-containing protein [Bryobacteraceae bacterium]|nr:zf-HC2 domain-containing protein [Bryobacteraceae bacterium]